MNFSCGCPEHTKGTAADIVCYDRSGKKISSKIVCCAAQDIGFNGIANIDSTYTATHVDTRSGLNWFGAETVTTVYSVTDDFYKHYKLSKTDVYGTSVTTDKRTKAITLTIDGVTYQGMLTEKMIHKKLLFLNTGQQFSLAKVTESLCSLLHIMFDLVEAMHYLFIIHILRFPECDTSQNRHFRSGDF